MTTFSDFDQRGYRTVDVRTGYSGWAGTYERSVEDAMDIALLDRLSVPPWSSFRQAADLGCGTGRTGQWLREHGVAVIDGVDLTPAMLAGAAARGVYRSLTESDLRATPLPSARYDLVTVSLVDEHLPDLQPLYDEAARLAVAGGFFVQVSYHPQFIMASGMPTHYTDASGESIAIATHLHLLSDHVLAGLQAGWTLVEMRERLIDDTWIALKPKWERYRNQPIAVAFAWRKGG